MKILIVEDEKDISDLIKLYLENEGHETVAAYDGVYAWEKFREDAFDFLLIDIVIPGINGYLLLKRIREISDVPVIMLTSKSDDSDVVLGLGLGADDYMTKPFSHVQLVARINAQYRRYRIFHTPEDNELVEIDGICLSTSECSLTVNGEEIPLNKKEFGILKMLMENPGRVFTKRQIYESVWEGEYLNDENTVIVHISRLREKIEVDQREPVYLKTVRGIGYKFKRAENK